MGIAQTLGARLFHEVETPGPEGTIHWRLRQLDVAEAARSGLVMEALGVVLHQAQPLAPRMEQEAAAAEELAMARREQRGLLEDIAAAVRVEDAETTQRLRARFEELERLARKAFSKLRQTPVPEAKAVTKAMDTAKRLICQCVVAAFDPETNAWEPITLVMDEALHAPDQGRLHISTLDPITQKLLQQAIWRPGKEAADRLGRFRLDRDTAPGAAGSAGASVQHAAEPAAGC